MSSKQNYDYQYRCPHCGTGDYPVITWHSNTVEGPTVGVIIDSPGPVDVCMFNKNKTTHRFYICSCPKCRLCFDIPSYKKRSLWLLLWVFPFNLPLSLVAFYYSSMVRQRLNESDAVEALRYSKKTKKWCWIAFVTPLFLSVFLYCFELIK